jgi:DNA-nicking Smr family endonuclease
MPRRRYSLDNRPFESLGGLLERKKIRLPAVRLPDMPQRPLSPAEERRLFREAMADVVPLAGRSVRVPTASGYAAVRSAPEDPDADAYRQLKKLVETGDGFVLRHTAEYVQGATCWLPPELFRRMHGGHFSIQDHVDLHGLNRVAARERFDAFMQDSTARGYRTILVVHGRGRSSPGPPVLKRELFRWLTRGPWKRWVIAFTSARSCDGGTGATYVLLRRTPRTGRHP